MMGSGASACLFALTLLLGADAPQGARQMIVPELTHLRSGEAREWADFPETAGGRRLEQRFAASPSAGEATLQLRQQDVKQGWNVLLNGKRIGELVRDENDMVILLSLPAGSLTDGENVLVVEPAGARVQISDDIRVGECAIIGRPRGEVLGESTIEVSIVDGDSGAPLPARLTVLNADGAMQSVGAQSNDHLAVRPGVVFTSTGSATFGVPAGQYTVLAGRGFEYSLARQVVDVSPGGTQKLTLNLRREVPTEGYVACDTHVHTLTHSGHGDATIDERMITIAGEGIELPVAADHNKHIDYEPTAAERNVRRFFTPTMGNEVTTPRGHFNIFPIDAGAPVVDHRQADWALLFDDIEKTPGVQVAILNHARDLHSGVRPFGPENHIDVVGENIHGWPLRFNAMEVINSGATQTDSLQLCRDWMGLLNRGMKITPVGSSDSHDVSRHFVGQGRTYIRTNDRDPGKIDVQDAIASFRRGEVSVSYGLLVDLSVNQKFRSGQLATGLGDEISVHARVLGPAWVNASRITLFANGQAIREMEIPSTNERSLPTGVKWEGRWTLPKPKHDVHLVAIATGPGIEGLHWRTAKPYQPRSTDPRTIVFGCTGALWIDADGDGLATPAAAYAEKIVQSAAGDVTNLITALASFDEAVAAQAAHRIAARAPLPENLSKALEKATPATKAGFEAYSAAWREHEIARAAPK